ncbi:MAG TPA: hypothetical protein VGF62_10865, partial [Rhizomicrobium sp.]
QRDGLFLNLPQQKRVGIFSGWSRRRSAGGRLRETGHGLESDRRKGGIAIILYQFRVGFIPRGPAGERALDKTITPRIIDEHDSQATVVDKGKDAHCQSRIAGERAPPGRPPRQRR